ncbi:endonuclease domain-containing protein [Sphingomonas phyllosphaerae]|uniref:endonuclease domain-containing protein n=1 Tax=Sphingomonas phyllosphaerae TaxID=257003 RepID=UPI0024135DF8|nr:endonuclease domain-containing protein [Sphingomonas phyllosphaerae]
MTPKDENRRLNSPPLQGRGRGWGLSANAIAGVQANARALRNNPTEPEKRLWSALSRAQLGGYKFRRQAAIGRYITDFLCPATRLIVEVDGDTHADPAADIAREADLRALGYRILRFANADVMRNLDGVLATLLAQLQAVPSRRRPTPTPPLQGRGFRNDDAHD